MSATPKPTPVVPTRSGRMSLASVSKGKIEQPIRVVVYGPEGVGKSTFGANAPNAIFLGAEDGTAQLNVERLPSPENWPDVLHGLQLLTSEAHAYKTLVVDTLDWAEPLLWDYIRTRDNEESIESYGYGKGYQAALDEWRIFLAALERLRRAKGMHVVLVAHSQVKSFKNPQGEDYDRYEMKLNAKAAGLMREWCDAVLFANFEEAAREDKRTKRVRGISTGYRLVRTQRTAAYDAKNRYSLPEELPLSWTDFEAGVRAHQPADPASLTSEVTRKAKEAGGKVEVAAHEAVRRANGDAQRLAELNDWLNAKLAEKGAHNE